MSDPETFSVIGMPKSQLSQMIATPSAVQRSLNKSASRIYWIGMEIHERVEVRCRDQEWLVAGRCPFDPA